MKKKTKSICNPCFDGDHNECVDKRCECPCKPRNPQPQESWEEKLKRNPHIKWIKELVPESSYNEIFIQFRTLLEDQKREIIERLPKKYGCLPEKLDNITERDELVSRITHNALLDEIIKRLK